MKATFGLVLGFLFGCSGSDDGPDTGTNLDAGPTSRWPPGAREAVAERLGCGETCAAMEILIFERRLDWDGLKTLDRTFIFVYVRHEAYYVGTHHYFERDGWLPYWLDTKVTSGCSPDPPTLAGVRPALESWTFEIEDPIYRGRLVEGIIYYDTWERIFGERPTFAYPEL
jgi:hypothetical protein